MKISNRGVALIKRHEGLRLNAYLDPVGIPTIGYGHTLGVKLGDIMTPHEAEQALKRDLQVAENEINRHGVALNQNQFDALVSFIFNLGVGNFRRSTLLKKIKADPCDKSIELEFMKWIYAGGKVLAGLVKRRKEERTLYFDKNLF